MILTEPLRPRLPAALQVSHSPYRGLLHCAQQTLREEGPAAFYKSYWTTVRWAVWCGGRGTGGRGLECVCAGEQQQQQQQQQQQREWSGAAATKGGGDGASLTPFAPRSHPMSLLLPPFCCLPYPALAWPAVRCSW